jgi:hypothetical protein
VRGKRICGPNRARNIFHRLKKINPQVATPFLPFPELIFIARFFRTPNPEPLNPEDIGFI